MLTSTRLIPGGGYFNAGGIDTSGREFAATVRMPLPMSVYTACTFNEAAYVGSGDPLADANQDIVAGTDVAGIPSRLWVVSLDRGGPIGTGLKGPGEALERLTAGQPAEPQPSGATMAASSTASSSSRLPAPQGPLSFLQAHGPTLLIPRPMLVRLSYVVGTPGIFADFPLLTRQKQPPQCTGMEILTAQVSKRRWVSLFRRYGRHGRHVSQAKPRDKSRKLYDSRGLYVEIAPRGTKAWCFKYRFAGKEERISMGIYPEVSLKLARRRRDEARKLLARDIDPSAYPKAQKQSRRHWARNSFEAVTAEWLAKHAPNWSTGHVRRLERQLAQNVFPYIGAKPVGEVTAPELLAVVRRVEERGHLQMAHGILQTCGRVLRYAVATGRADRDVSWDLRGALPPAKGKHFAAITDPKEVGPLLRLLDGYSGTLTVRCTLRLAPLVFVRPGELCKAEWAEADRFTSAWGN